MRQFYIPGRIGVKHTREGNILMTILSGEVNSTVFSFYGGKVS